MRIAQVIGTLTLNQIHPNLIGGTFKLVVPLTLNELARGGADESVGAAEELVAYDELGVGIGQAIMLSEGGEAAQPFYPNLKPVDAYNAGIVDSIHLDSAAMKLVNTAK